MFVGLFHFVLLVIRTSGRLVLRLVLLACGFIVRLESELGDGVVLRIFISLVRLPIFWQLSVPFGYGDMKNIL